jgi:hypothetical protein
MADGLVMTIGWSCFLFSTRPPRSREKFPSRDNNFLDFDPFSISLQQNHRNTATSFHSRRTHSHIRILSGDGPLSVRRTSQQVKMATSLAAQLSQIAAKSTNPLDLKAQRIAHSQSLIFEPKIAGSQDFDTIYQICHEGFQELCLLDSRFTEFDRTIFSLQSKAEERTEMTAAQNKELDVVLESFLALVGSKLLLSPAIKAVDWLVRRFRYGITDRPEWFLLTRF